MFTKKKTVSSPALFKGLILELSEKRKRIHVTIMSMKSNIFPSHRKQIPSRAMRSSTDLNTKG